MSVRYCGDDKPVGDLRGVAALLEDGWQAQQGKEGLAAAGIEERWRLKWWWAVSAAA